MTPFGTRLRHLRAERGVTLKRLAAELQVSSAYEAIAAMLMIAATPTLKTSRRSIRMVILHER